jgi:antitoxin PrlF
MRITSKGQVTIPKHIREEAGLMPGAEVEFSLEDGVVRLERSRRKPSRGEEIVRRMAGTATVRMTTDEIMKLMRG